MKVTPVKQQSQSLYSAKSSSSTPTSYPSATSPWKCVHGYMDISTVCYSHHISLHSRNAILLHVRCYKPHLVVQS